MYRCLGLAIPPRIRFLQREQKRLSEKASTSKSKDKVGKALVPDSPSDDSDEESDSDGDDDEIGVSSDSGSEESSVQSESESRRSKNRHIKGNDQTDNVTVCKSTVFDVEEEDDDFLTVKKRHVPPDEEDQSKSQEKVQCR